MLIGAFLVTEIISTDIISGAAKHNTEICIFRPACRTGSKRETSSETLNLVYHKYPSLVY